MSKSFAAIAMFLFASGACFGQIAPIATGNVLTYDVFNVSRSLFSSEFTFKQKDPRVLKLTIEETGDRKYEFLNGKPFIAMDKYFTEISYYRNNVDGDEHFQHIPRNKKLSAGMQWSYTIKNVSKHRCGDWSTVYNGTTKEGPVVTINIDGKDTSIQTILIEQTGSSKFEFCTPQTQEESSLYSPDLNEIVKNQRLDFQPGSKTPDSDGWKWELKSISTGQAQK